MNPKETIFDPRTFDDQSLNCKKCGWKGTGADARIIDFYGVSKLKQVSCPNCLEYLGNLSNEHSFARGGNDSNS